MPERVIIKLKHVDMTLKTGAGSFRKYHYLHSKYHFVESDLLVNSSLNMLMVH